MAYSGAWRAANVTPLEYAGALKWGTGINPVHGQPDEHISWTTHEPLLPPADDDAVPETILGPTAWGYCSDDAAASGGTIYEYQREWPSWDEPVDRGTADHFPGWGPHGSDTSDPDAWPLPTYPGGEDIRATSYGAEHEALSSVASPSPGSLGGWESKDSGAVNDARTSDPSQYEINTSMNQLRREMTNDRAVARMTDDARASIQNRLTGVKLREFAKSQGMGGGPGTPDMAPVTQDLPSRPFFYRSPGVPPDELHTWSEMSQFEPLARDVPPDPGSLVTTQEDAGAASFGYTPGDFYV